VDKALLDTDIFSEVLKGVDREVVAKASRYRSSLCRIGMRSTADIRPLGTVVPRRATRNQDRVTRREVSDHPEKTTEHRPCLVRRRVND
jgi:hypothetical protein